MEPIHRSSWWKMGLTTNFPLQLFCNYSGALWILMEILSWSDSRLAFFLPLLSLIFSFIFSCSLKNKSFFFPPFNCWSLISIAVKMKLEQNSFIYLFVHSFFPWNPASFFLPKSDFRDALFLMLLVCHRNKYIHMYFKRKITQILIPPALISEGNEVYHSQRACVPLLICLSVSLYRLIS